MCNISIKSSTKVIYIGTRTICIKYKQRENKNMTSFAADELFDKTVKSHPEVFGKNKCLINLPRTHHQVKTKLR